MLKYSLEKTLNTSFKLITFRYTFGETFEPEFNHTDPIPVHMYWTEVPPIVTLESGVPSQTWYFVASLSIDRADAESAYDEAMANVGGLYQENAQVWIYPGT